MHYNDKRGIMKMQRIKLTHLLGIFCMLMLSSYASAQTYAMSQGINQFISSKDPYCSPETEGGNDYVNLPSGSVHVINTSQFNDDRHLCEVVSTTGTSVPAGVVDWVLLELRAINAGGVLGDATKGTVVARKPAFLLANGRVVDAEMYADLADGERLPANAADDPCEDMPLDQDNACPDVVFSEGNVSSSVSGKDLFLVVRHRNHLDIMSSGKLGNDGSIYTYDFTDDATKAAGGVTGIKNNAGRNNNRVAMYAGDVNYSDSINTADFNILRPNIGRSIVDGNYGTIKGNVNLSVSINIADFNALRPNIGKSTRITP